MKLLEKHILLNALIEQEKRLIKKADDMNHYRCPQTNPDTYKDMEGFKKSVKEYHESEKGIEEKTIRQMAKDLKAQINLYEQHILEIALDEIKKLQS